MKKENSLTKSEAIQKVTEQLDKPIHIDDFTQRVLDIWPSKAKKPQASIRNEIWQVALGKILLSPDKTELIPMRIGMNGVRIRIRLIEEEIQQGLLSVDRTFQFVAPHHKDPEEFFLEDDKGQEIQKILIRNSLVSLFDFGTLNYQHLFFNIEDWYLAEEITCKDTLLLTVLDWETAHFQISLEREDHRTRYLEKIEEKNSEFADCIFNILENELNEYVSAKNAVAHAYYLLCKDDLIVSDPWYEIIQNDSRMIYQYFEICYPEDDIFFEYVPKTNVIPDKSVEKQQEKNIITFKVSLRDKKKIWRRIEIRGEQTLEDLDLIIKSGFNYERFEHLSGFWKFVRRGETSRFREIDLGRINPFEAGYSKALTIADLDLSVADRLKYVYDFGEWIEHDLIVENVNESEADTVYPRITDRNKPKYLQCVSCREKGEKTIAKLICITCSNRFQKEIVLCDRCASKFHSEHYLDEILY